jgi:long-subunit acyl-CoA synthetase (AMP-forming)
VWRSFTQPCSPCCHPLQVPRDHQQVSLSLLPPWHIYERTVAYYILSCACRQVYSSVKRLKGDLAKFQPNYLVCVPLVLSTLHDRILHSLHKMSAARRGLATWLIKVAEMHTRVRCPLAAFGTAMGCFRHRNQSLCLAFD